MKTLTQDKINAVKELAEKNGLHFHYYPSGCGFQVGLKTAGIFACEVVYTSWKRQGYRIDSRSQNRKELAKQMQAIIEA